MDIHIEPIGRGSLVDGVVEQLQRLIGGGHFGSGDRLPSEHELARKFGVSRPVLREAVGKMKALGLVSVQNGRGIFVGDRSSLASSANLVRNALAIAPRELFKFAELRSAIECDAARRAARRATPEDLERLQALCDEIAREDVPYEETVRADLRFHRAIVDLSGNELTSNLMDVIHDFILSAIVHTTEHPRDRARSRRLHLKILAAIRTRDPATAEHAMRGHMDVSEKVLGDAAGG